MRDGDGLREAMAENGRGGEDTQGSHEGRTQNKEGNKRKQQQVWGWGAERCAHCTYHAYPTSSTIMFSPSVPLDPAF